MRLGVALFFTGAIVVGAEAYARDNGPRIPLSPEDAEALTPLGHGVIGEPIPAPIIENAKDWYGLRPGAFKSHITSGSDKGKVYVETVSKIPETSEGATWQRTRPEYDDVLRVSSEAVELSSSIDHKYGLLVRYDPVGHLLAANLRPEESHKFNSKVVVYKSSHPDKEDSTGSMEDTQTYVGAYKVITPAGVFDAVLFRNEFRVNVNLVDVQDTRYSFYAKGVGKVAGIEHQHATALLIINLDDKIPKVLA